PFGRDNQIGAGGRWPDRVVRRTTRTRDNAGTSVSLVPLGACRFPGSRFFPRPRGGAVRWGSLSLRPSVLAWQGVLIAMNGASQRRWLTLAVAAVLACGAMASVTRAGFPYVPPPTGISPEGPISVPPPPPPPPPPRPTPHSAP